MGLNGVGVGSVIVNGVSAHSLVVNSTGMYSAVVNDGMRITWRGHAHQAA